MNELNWGDGSQSSYYHYYRSLSHVGKGEERVCVLVNKKWDLFD